ncbi:MAG: hypothetical protein WAV31_03235 [Candidatus Moraniibacteriota bacterium]
MMMKKMALAMVIMAIGMFISSTKATATEVEILRSEDTAEFNSFVDMLDEDKDGTTAEVDFGDEKYVIFYKTIETGVTKEKIAEINVMAATPNSGETMRVLSDKTYTLSVDGKVTFPIGFTVNTELKKEFFYGPCKVFVKLKK